MLGVVAKFEAQGSPESVRRSLKNRRVQMQVPEPQLQTPRTIKPTIVYPCSPGGTEIRPPTSTPPKTPLTASPVQDTASAQSAQGLEYRVRQDGGVPRSGRSGSVCSWG